MFRNGTGFQIYGGSFYDVQWGDVNLHTHQHLTLQDRTLREVVSQASLPSPATLTAVDGSAEGYGHELSGVVRNTRHTVGRAPYDMASRRHISTSSAPFGHEDCPVPLASYSNAIISSSPHRPSSDPSSERVAESDDLAMSASTSDATRLPSHADFSTPPSPDRPSSHPSERMLSKSTPAGGIPETSSGHDSPSQPLPGGTYITAQNVNHIHRHGETGIDILHHAAALEALHDSAESFPQPKCHPETRTGILNNLYNWAIGSDPALSIFWLYGPAGAGKSAIMQTLCRRLKDGGRLGGSFFFKRGHKTRGNAQALFATLAYQLLLETPALKGPISKSAEEDPSLVGRSMYVQLEKLVVRPCESLRNLNPPILLIDGLDECESQNVQQELLRLISDTVREYPHILRIIIASRPEPHIREMLERPSVNRLYRRLNIGQSFVDVEKYLRDEFSRIRREHLETMGWIATPWTSSDILDKLVEKSSGYFIYASTVIKFIDDRDFRPTERLSMVVDWQNIPADSDRPFEALDQLYTQILRMAPTRSRLVRILSVLDNFPKLSSGEIEQLLELNAGNVGLSLRRLHSVLRVSSDDSPISVYHASFRDFLSDPIRSGEFCVATSQRHIELGHSVLKALSYAYHDSTTERLQSSSKHVSWSLGCSGIEYLISSVPPVAKLMPLIRYVNLECLWRSKSFIGLIPRMIDWLKKIEPAAMEDVIYRWQDYQLLDVCHSMFVWYSLCPDSELEHPNQYRELFSRFPLLLRVLQASVICSKASFSGRLPTNLFSVRLLLDIPWDEMHALTRGPLHSFNKDDGQVQPLLTAAQAADSCPGLRIDLARGCFRLLKGIGSGNLPRHMWIDNIRWEEIIEQCPKSPELLEDLRSLEYSSFGFLNDFNNPMSWLKSHHWI